MDSIPAVVITSETSVSIMLDKQIPFTTYGVPSGPVMSALMMSTLVSSTRRKILESHATGRFVVRTASCMCKYQLHTTSINRVCRLTSFAIAKDLFGISEFANILASLLK